MQIKCPQRIFHVCVCVCVCLRLCMRYKNEFGTHIKKYAYGPHTDTDTHTGCTYTIISEKYAAGTVFIVIFKNDLPIFLNHFLCLYITNICLFNQSIIEEF